MAAPLDIAAYSDVVVVLATAAVAIPLLQRLRINPVLGYLLTGVVLGPHLLGSLVKAYPALFWVTVDDPARLTALAELGVVFLLFIIGLELSPQRLWTMRRLVFGLGSLQIVLCGLAIAGVALMLGQSPEAATLIGFSLALSSTAIVIEMLSAQNRLAASTGRASFAILLMQDLAVIPLLLLVPILGTGGEASILRGIAMAIGQALLAIVVVGGLGYAVLRPLFRLVASNESQDLFVAAVLLVAVGSGMLTALAGASMALGAFVAGLLLAETEYRKAIETTIEPIKGLLLGVFFFSVGASLDLSVVAASPHIVLAGVGALILLKGALIALLTRLFGFSWTVAARTGAILGPGGEFALIVLGLALTAGILDQKTNALLLAITSLSMALIPLLDAFAQRAFPIAPMKLTDPALLAAPQDVAPSAIVVGYGRVGGLVSDMLTVHGVPHLITEKRPDLVGEGRTSGKTIYFGDATLPHFLERCGLKQAKAVIITIHDWAATDEIVAAIRSASATVTIVARARDAEHAKHLYETGVTDAVPETIEASLQLSEAALVDLGIPAGPVIASIHEKRDEFRAALQTAAGQAGRNDTRGLRAKSLSKS
jgi:monovalent cation:H+ antiporter-2, CPA2 family